MITITDVAVSQINKMMSEQEEEINYLRVGVQGGGCSGLTYGMGFETESSENDLTFEKGGLKVLVDKEDASILQGLKIDYKQNMMSGGFTIDNPNAVATCGCGSSFKTATNAGAPEEC